MRSLERPLTALVAVSLVALPLAHGLALALRAALGGAEPLAALGLSGTVLACALAAAAAACPRTGRGAPATAGAGVGLVAAGTLAAGSAHAAALTALVVGPLVGQALARLARALPVALDGAARRRPATAAAWGLVALAAVLQTARIATFMTDDGFAAGPTIPGYFAHHMCLPAYVQAAELHAAGEPDVYDPAHYPGLARDAAPTTDVDGMQRYLEDPFQYPPPFLLVGELMRRSGAGFHALRTAWFALQALALAAVVVLAARWTGGAAGRRALLLAPLLWLAPATNFNFQYGQAHLLVILAAVGAMLAAERGRDALAGSLLAAAVLAKLFPALLLVVWVVERRWRALRWAAAAGAALVALTLAVLGTQPWSAFFVEHLPRLADGSAFAFDAAWPELRTVLVAGNQSPLGLVEKLVELGFDGARALAPALNAGFLLACGLAALGSGLRRGTRAERAASWLALLSLGAMQSGGAWAEYVTVSVLWMLTFAAPPAGALGRALRVLAWVWFLALPGSLPPLFWEGPGAIALSAAGFALAVGACARAALARAPSPDPLRVPASVLGPALGRP